MMYNFQPNEVQVIAAFRAAVARGEVVVNLPKASQAVTLRAQAYAFGKKMRKLCEASEYDAHLQEVADLTQKVTMIVEGDALIIRRKDTGPVMDALKAAIAAAGVEAVDPNEEVIKESERKLLEKLGMTSFPEAEAPPAEVAGPAPGSRVTKYYTR